MIGMRFGIYAAALIVAFVGTVASFSFAQTTVPPMPTCSILPTPEERRTKCCKPRHYEIYAASTSPPAGKTNLYGKPCNYNIAGNSVVTGACIAVNNCKCESWKDEKGILHKCDSSDLIKSSQPPSSPPPPSGSKIEEVKTVPKPLTNADSSLLFDPKLLEKPPPLTPRTPEDEKKTLIEALKPAEDPSAKTPSDLTRPLLNPELSKNYSSLQTDHFGTVTDKDGKRIPLTAPLRPMNTFRQPPPPQNNPAAQQNPCTTNFMLYECLVSASQKVRDAMTPSRDSWPENPFSLGKGLFINLGIKSQPLNKTAVKEISTAAQIFCEGYDCKKDSDTIAKGITAVGFQENRLDPRTEHPGSKYQGFPQTEDTYGTPENLETLKMLASNPKLNDEQRLKVQSIINRHNKLVAAGWDPRFDPEVGPWHLVAQQFRLPRQDNLAPALLAAKYANGDPQKASAFMMAGQLQPHIFKDPYASISPQAVSQLRHNHVKVSSNYNAFDVVAAISGNRVYTANFAKGIEAADSYARESLQIASRSGPKALAYTPPVEPIASQIVRVVLGSPPNNVAPQYAPYAGGPTPLFAQQRPSPPFSIDAGIQSRFVQGLGPAPSPLVPTIRPTDFARYTAPLTAFPLTQQTTLFPSSFPRQIEPTPQTSPIAGYTPRPGSLPLFAQSPLTNPLAPPAPAPQPYLSFYEQVRRSTPPFLVDPFLVAIAPPRYTNFPAITHNLYPESPYYKEVRMLQSWLTSQGYPVASDGDYGPITKNAVARWQRGMQEQGKCTNIQRDYGYFGPKSRACAGIE